MIKLKDFTELLISTRRILFCVKKDTQANKEARQKNVERKERVELNLTSF